MSLVMEAEQVLFDHVMIKVGSGENLHSAQWWQEQPVSQKMELTLQHKVTFLRNGQIVPMSEIRAGLKAQREARMRSR